MYIVSGRERWPSTSKIYIKIAISKFNTVCRSHVQQELSVLFMREIEALCTICVDDLS